MNTLLSRTRVLFFSFAFLLLAGAVAYVNIPKESAPDVPIPIAYVSLHYDGIAPEDSVNLLIKPLEKELRTLEGLDELESTAYEGGGNVVAKFVAGYDMDTALNDVREAVDIAKAELPQEADEPRVVEVNISLFPILTIILEGDVPERRMKELTENLQDKIEGLGGVLEAPIKGLREEQVLLEIDKTKLEDFGLSPATVVQAVNNNNRLIAAGSLEVGGAKYAIKVPGLIQDAEQLLNLPLRHDGMRQIRLKDVAEVRLTFKDPTNQTRVNGKPAVSLEVSKRIGENIIETVDAVKRVVQEEAQPWPAHLSYQFVSDESSQTRRMLSDLQNNVALSVLLVMVVVLAAMGLRSALLVATTVPGSFLTAILILYALGFTTNTVVLFALILSVGLLVDGAIVVTELADSYLRQGKGRVEAFSQAAKEMGLPIIASTATTLAAFMPLLFWPDTVGEFMKFMPITLIFTLSASLLMALIFLPAIGCAMPRPPAQKKNDKPTFFDKLSVRYEKILLPCLNRPWWTLGAVMLCFLGGIGSYTFLGKGVEFFPSIEPERANLIVRSKGDYSLQERVKVMLELEEKLLALDGVQTLYITAGASSGGGGGNQQPEDTVGTVAFEYAPWKAGRPTSDVILAEALSRTSMVAGIMLEKQEEEAGPQSGKPIQIQVTAPTFRLLPPIVNEIRQELAQVEGLVDIDDDLPAPGIEWQVDISREEAARYGTDLSAVGTNLRLATNGAIVGTYRAPGKSEEVDIVARYAETDRTLNALKNMYIATPKGSVPLGHMATVSPQPKVGQIKRLDERAAVTISANLKEGVLADTIVQGLQKEMTERQAELPNGVRIEFRGENEDQQKAGGFLQKAFAVALFVMAFILVLQFNSFYQAFIVLSAVVLSTTGVLVGHILMGKPFGIVMSGLGVIALAGIVVNNNIVLISTYNALKGEIKDWKTRVIETGKRRLRPVLLTAMTTIIGLLPLSFKVNVDIVNRHVSINAPSSQWWDQLAASIVFGLTFATVLTLIATPCLLALKDRRTERRLQQSQKGTG